MNKEKNDALFCNIETGICEVPDKQSVIEETDEDDNRFKMYGSKPYESYEQALLKLYPEAVKRPIDTAFENIFSHYPTLTSKEFGVLTNRSKDDAEDFLNDLYKQNKIGKFVSKNGVLWTVS